MSAKTKIVVLRMKELIYTGICAAIAILVIAILLLVFAPGDDKSSSGDTPETPAGVAYVPGVYTTQLMLGDHTTSLEVIADETGIASIRLTELNDAVTTMYPLLEPALASISEQFMETGSLENIQYEDSSRYTSLVLLEALEKTLEKALPADESLTE